MYIVKNIIAIRRRLRKQEKRLCRGKAAFNGEKYII